MTNLRSEIQTDIERLTQLDVEMVVSSFEAASYGTTFRMILEAQSPSALLRNVKKVGVERTAIVKYANI